MGVVFHWLFGWGGIGLIVMIAAIVIAVIEPAIFTYVIPRRYAIEVAIVAAFLTFSSAKFYKDGADYVQGKWDAAVKAAIDKGTKARSDAERNVDGNPDGGVRDPDNRDR